MKKYLGGITIILYLCSRFRLIIPFTGLYFKAWEIA